MMPSCLAGKPDMHLNIQVEDLRKNLFYDLDAIDKRNSAEVEKEHLQVFLRIRPFTSSERSDKDESQGCVAVEGQGTVVLKAPTFNNKQNEKFLPQTAQRFTFTQVFRPDCGQKQMFEGTARHLVREFLEGRNSLVFTYGVTNAGKTFTFLGPDSDLGLLPRSLAVIFNSIEGRVFTECSVKPHRFRDFVRLDRGQQVKENAAKRQLLRLVKESEVHSGMSSLSSSSSSSTFLEGSSVSGDCSVASGSAADVFCLDAESNTKFSVWVSFCEIYNENIHDLLEQLPSGISRRMVLRLSQDVKGNSFVKDLRWVQVNTSDEAYRVMKVGKKNQSISATRLNHTSSRSHSIFSIRILRIDDGPVPRVHTISELSLCDLAGSERCARARTGGERLKEAGNINTSLLTLGKCMNALRLNQQNKNKCQQHVPFRESKLTHFLQSYFTGGGNACMIVNVSPCASAHDETINVLKFSAIAQKVVLLRPVLVQPSAPSAATQRAAREVSMRIDAVLRPKGLRDSMASMGWENSICLEDVEEEDEEEEVEEEEEEEEESVMDGTMDGTILEQEEETTTAMEVHVQQADTLALEMRIREEVAAEFEELMNQRENDYKERLQLELQIAEDRSEKRLEIFKNLVRDTKEDANLESSRLSQSHSTELEDMRLEKQVLLQTVEQKRLKVSELLTMCLDKDRRIDTLQEALDNATNEIHSMQQQLLELNSCLHLTEAEREASLIRDGGASLIGDVGAEKSSSSKDQEGPPGAEEEKSSSKDQGGPLGGEKEGGRKRHAEEPVGGGPARKRVLLEDEIWRLQEENEGKEQTIALLTEEARANGEREQEESRAREEQRRAREEDEESRAREEKGAMEEVEELKKERSSLERRVEDLTADITEHSSDYENLMLALESEQRETTRLNKENKALVNGIFQLQSTEQAHKDQVSRLQSQLAEQTDRAADLSEQLDAARARLQDLESQSDTKTRTIDGLRREVARLTQDADGLRQEAKDSVDAEQRSGAFRSAIERLQTECQGALERSAQKSQEIEELQKHVAQLSTQLTDRESVSLQLREELSGHKADSSTQLEVLQSEKSLLTQQAESLLTQVKASEESCARATVLEQRLSESEAQCAALRERLEEMARAEEEMKTAYERASEEVARMKASQSQQEEEDKGVPVVEGLKEEDEKGVPVVEGLKEEKGVPVVEGLKEEKGVPVVEGLKEEKGVAVVVEELKEELRRLDERRNRELEVKMKRELERLQQLNGTQLSPLQPNIPRRGTRGQYSSTKKTSRKRSTNMQDMEQSENKRPRQRGYGRAVVLQSPLSTRRDGALQMIGDIIHNSPTILGSKAKTIMSMMSGRSTDMEQPVATEAKPKRARRKLYKKDISSPLMDMSPMMASVGEKDEKESDHHIITRKLRSRTTRK